MVLVIEDKIVERAPEDGSASRFWVFGNFYWLLEVGQSCLYSSLEPVGIDSGTDFVFAADKVGTGMEGTVENYLVGSSLVVPVGYC